MKNTMHRVLALALASAAVLSAADAYAFRMIQPLGTGRTSSGYRVKCDDPGGFAHWNTTSISFRHNTANQGGESGVAAALQNAASSWTSVSPAGYNVGYGGTTTAGFVTDGVNALLWATGNGCTGSCLAITALVIASGHVITETDVSFNNSVNWNTNGSDYDTQAIAAHEIGHCLGIHHTEINKPRNRPTMYAYYFGTAGRTLENDDAGALNCAWNRYPPAGANATAPGELSSRPAVERSVTLSSRPRAGGAVLRFALRNEADVKLQVFDVAGRLLGTLVEGRRPAGEHEVAWDGATSFGRAASGVYFARIVTPEAKSAATVILAE